MNLTILTDGNKEFGLGHLYRSQALAMFLIMKGHSVEVITLSAINLKTLFINNDVIIDIPYHGDFLHKKINNNSKIIGLDYNGEVNLDLVINVFDYQRYMGSNQISSFEYVIIREQISNLINKTFIRNEAVLIMLGAHDINNYATDIIKSLDEKKIQTVVVEKEKSIDFEPFNYCIGYENPDNVAQIMQCSAWAISNGGSSMLELMSLGKATHVFPQTKAEKALATKIFKEGGILGIGAPISYPSIEKINSVGNIAKKMIDGLGLNRLEERIKEIVE